MTLKVPLTGTTVTPEGAGSSGGADTPVQTRQTEPARQSLHNVRMTPTQAPAEVQPQFDSFGRVKWVPVEAQDATAQQEAGEVTDGEQLDASMGVDASAGNNGTPSLPGSQSTDVGVLQQQVERLTQTVTLMAQAQLKGMQPEPAKPQAPQPPDPAQFDLYDPQSFAEFQRLNNAYMQAQIQHSVNEALAPHGNALQDAELNRQYNHTVATYGGDPNFKPNMEAALKLVASFGLSIPDAYKHVASNQLTSPHQAAPSQSAKPAQRTITAQEAAQKAEQAKKLPASNGVNGTAEPALPPALRNVAALGRIMLHNQQSGRARPI